MKGYNTGFQSGQSSSYWDTAWNTCRICNYFSCKHNFWHCYV